MVPFALVIFSGGCGTAPWPIGFNSEGTCGLVRKAYAGTGVVLQLRNDVATGQIVKLEVWGTELYDWLFIPAAIPVGRSKPLGRLRANAHYLHGAGHSA